MTGISAYLKLSKLASPQEDSCLAHLPAHDLDSLQHLAGYVSSLLFLHLMRP